MNDWTRALAQSLEKGTSSRWRHSLARVWEARSERTLVKASLAVGGAKTIGVGGATLGGGGKTAVAIALTRLLAEQGGAHDRGAVVLVGHGYRAHGYRGRVHLGHGAAPSGAREVTLEDTAEEVGDEAILARGQLGIGRVVVGVPSSLISRDTGPALSHAAGSTAGMATPRVMVFDGLLQTRPTPLSLSLLVLDGERPWGSGACPPAGDLRAPVSALVDACDALVLVHNEWAIDPCSNSTSRTEEPPPSLPTQSNATHGKPVLAVRRRMHLPSQAQVTAPFGLILRLAHPERIVQALSLRGMHPACTFLLGDHRPLSPRALREAERASHALGLGLWLCTAKCAVMLPDRLGGVQVRAIEEELVFPSAELRSLLLRAGFLGADDMIDCGACKPTEPSERSSL